MAHIEYEELQHFLKKISKSGFGKALAVGLTASTGGAGAPLAAKIYKDSDDAEQRAFRQQRAQDAAEQAAAWEAEEKRSKTFDTFWKDWQDTLALREKVGFALEEARVRVEKLVRRSGDRIWPVSFDEALTNAKIELRAASYAVQNAPPVSFTDPNASQEDLDEAIQMNGLERADFQAALQKIEKLGRDVGELERLADDYESRDRIKARYRPGLSGLGYRPPEGPALSLAGLAVVFLALWSRRQS